MAYFIGLISGTSMDAIDAALVNLDGAKISLIAYQETPYSAEITALLHRAVVARTALTADDFGALHSGIGREFAAAANRLVTESGLQADDIAAIGSHGQTLTHRPRANPPFSVQLGDPSVIAYHTGITTVADFRAMDIAAGGQGAPLVPPFHVALFGGAGHNIAVVNLGGIANITLIPAASGSVIAFDCGPANTLLDNWIQRHLGVAYDAKGAWASRGKVIPELLQLMLQDPYFAAAPPKSTGREYFNLTWLDRILGSISRTPFAPHDVQRTLLELTVSTVATAVQATMPDVARVLLCGGGAQNSALYNALQTSLRVNVNTTDALGFSHAAIEAMAFAWLAARRLNGLPGNLPSVTGADRPLLLGGIYSAA